MASMDKVLLAIACATMLALLYFICFPMRAGDPGYLWKAGVSGVKQILIADSIYAADYDDRQPPANAWMDALRKYVNGDEIFRSPGLPGAKPGSPVYGLAFRGSLGNAKTTTDAGTDDVALIFDSDLTWRNAAADLDTLPDPPRYDSANGGCNVVGFAGGHAACVRDARALDPAASAR